MTAVGTALSVGDLRRLARRRGVLAAAVVVNVVVVPALAVGLSAVAGLAPPVGLGVVLAAAAPGGGAGALLTLHARGDLAVAAALQGLLGPLGLLAVPVWAAVAGYDVVPAGWPGVVLVGGGLLGQVVPLLAGMWLRRRDPARALRVHAVARRVADVLLAGLVAYFLITAGHRLPDLGWAPVSVAALLVTSCLAVTVLPLTGRADVAQTGVARAVGMTTAVRSVSLALFVATPAGPEVVLTVLAYGLVMYVLSVPAALVVARAGSG